MPEVVRLELPTHDEINQWHREAQRAVDAYDGAASPPDWERRVLRLLFALDWHKLHSALR